MMATMKRVLLVDDDAEVIDAMRAALELKGYEILVARDGNQALSLAEQLQPDLMVVELAIPKRSGFSVLEKFCGAEIPVIVATSVHGKKPESHAASLGASAYLCKPFPMDEFVDTVERHLN